MGGCGGGGSSFPLSPTDDYTSMGPFGPYREILGPGGPEKASIFTAPTTIPGEISKRAALPVLAPGDPGINDIVDAKGLQAYQLKVYPGKTWHVVKIWPRLFDDQQAPDKGDPDLYVTSVTQNFQALGTSLRWGKLLDFLAWQPNNTGNHVALVHGYGTDPAGYLIEYDLAPYIPVATPEVPVTKPYYYHLQEGNYWFSFEGLEGNNFFRIAFDYWDGKGWFPIDPGLWKAFPFYAWVYYEDSHGFVAAGGWHLRSPTKPYNAETNPRDYYTVDWHGKRKSWHFLHLHFPVLETEVSIRIRISTIPTLGQTSTSKSGG